MGFGRKFRNYLRKKPWRRDLLEEMLRPGLLPNNLVMTFMELSAS